MNTRKFSKRGSVMLEFSLTALPLLFIIISAVWLAMGMFQYHTVAEAVNVTARSATSHGAGCVGQTCATTVNQTALMLAEAAVGIPASSLNVTLTSSASTVNCNPLSNCYGNSAAWPTLAGNTAGTTDITVQATYLFASPISLWVPGGGKQQFSSVTLGAKSRQTVVY